MDGRDIPPGMEKCRLQRIGKIRGVKGAASCCALAAIGYLAARSLLQAGVSFLMGLRVEGASLSNPVGLFPCGSRAARDGGERGGDFAAHPHIVAADPAAHRRPSFAAPCPLEPGFLYNPVFGGCECRQPVRRAARAFAGA